MNCQILLLPRSQGSGEKEKKLRDALQGRRFANSLQCLKYHLFQAILDQQYNLQNIGTV